MKKKISFLRLFILLGIITVAGLLYFNIGHIVSKSVGKEKVKEKPWFASYVDATLMPQFDFEHVEEISSYLLLSHRIKITPRVGERLFIR